MTPEFFDRYWHGHQRQKKGGTVHVKKRWEERDFPTARVAQSDDVGVGMVYPDVDIIADIGRERSTDVSEEEGPHPIQRAGLAQSIVHAGVCTAHSKHLEAVTVNKDSQTKCQHIGRLHTDEGHIYHDKTHNRDAPIYAILIHPCTLSDEGHHFLV